MTSKVRHSPVMNPENAGSDLVNANTSADCTGRLKKVSPIHELSSEDES